MIKNVLKSMGIISLVMGIMFAVTGCDSDVAGPSLSNETAILSLSIPSIENAASDIIGSNITVTVPYGTTITTITPVFTISDGATSVPASGKEVTLIDGKSAITVTAEDGSTKQEYSLTVSVNDPSTDTTFTSTIGKFTNDGESLVGIPYKTTVDELRSAISLTVTTETSFDIVSSADTLNDDSLVVVNAQDGTTSKTYSVSVIDYITTNYDFPATGNSEIKNAYDLALAGISSMPEVDIEGIITSIDKFGFTIQDDEAAIYVFMNYDSTTTEVVGTKVRLTSLKYLGLHYGLPQIQLNGAFSSIIPLEYGRDIYFQDANTVILDDTNISQFFKYSGYAVGYSLNTKGMSYNVDSTVDAAVKEKITSYKGDFYGPYERNNLKKNIAINHINDFVPADGPVSIVFEDIINGYSLMDPAKDALTLELAKVEDYTISFVSSTSTTISKNTEGDSLVIDPPSVDENVDVVLSISNGSATENVTISLTVPAGTPLVAFESQLYLWEVDADLSSDPEVNEFIEVWNNTDALVDFSDTTKYFIVLINGSNDSTYDAYQLTGTVASDSVFTLGGSTVSGANMTFTKTDGNLQNGGDGILLLSSVDTEAAVADFSFGTDVDLTGGKSTVTLNEHLYSVVDVLVYGTGDENKAATKSLITKLGGPTYFDENSTQSLNRYSPDMWILKDTTPGKKEKE